MLRAITELWQQLRIIPVIDAPGKAARWQLLRLRFQKAIAEGASTSQVTAISVLASIYLQAVIAATMEEVEIFLSPLTARSKIREVLRGLVATRQVHTLNIGHAPHYYVAGTLPEFAPTQTIYASSAMSAGGYFSRFNEHEDAYFEPAAPEPVSHAPPAPAPAPFVPAEIPAMSAAEAATPNGATNSASNGASNGHKAAASNGKSTPARPHFSRPAQHARNRKPAQASTNARSPRRNSEPRPASSRSANASGHSSGSSRNGKSPVGSWSKRNGNGTAASGKSSSSNRTGTLSRGGAVRKDSRAETRTSRGNRTPALTAGAKAGNSKRYGFTARAKHGTNKRG